MSERLNKAALDLSAALRSSVKGSAPEHLSAWGAAASDLLSALGELLEGDAKAFNASDFRAHGLIRSAENLLKATEAKHHELSELADKIRSGSERVIRKSHEVAMLSLTSVTETQKASDLEQTASGLKVEINRATSRLPNFQNLIEQREQLLEAIKEGGPQLQDLEKSLPKLRQDREDQEKKVENLRLAERKLKEEIEDGKKTIAERQRSVQKMTKEKQDLIEGGEL